MFTRSRRVIICLLIWLTCVGICPATERPIRFNRDIRPVLTDKCFACHGPDAQTVEADLRLDLREVAVDHGAIMPGDADESELMRRILAEDEGEIMPPPEAHKPLTPQERELLRRWIDEGAEYEAHWAYTPLSYVDRPAGASHDGPAMIDHFIARRLAAEGVASVPEADRVTLIRRLSFDLTGVPPTPEEVDAFVSDPSQDAYAKLVDRLLASDRYGERMSIYWLDLVRYADTVGYHGDQNVSQWPYRDYVIQAFNSNMPYDQFVREQLAGDLLPQATLDQLVASGYNRLNQTTEEGGSQAKEYLAIYFADRVRNVSQVFMGATMGCAQCHDHKYDPYTTRDFYSLGAFFADLEEQGVYGGRGSRPPMIRVPDEALRQQLTALDERIAQLQAKVKPLRTELLANQTAWETEAQNRSAERPEEAINWIDDTQDTGGRSEGRWDFIGPKQGPVHSGEKSRRQSAEGLVQHYFDDAQKPIEVQPGMRFFAWVHLDPMNPPQAIMLQFNNGDWNHRAVWGTDDISYGLQPESWAGYFRSGEAPPTGEWVRLEADPTDVGLEPGDQVKGMAFTQFGGLVYWDEAGWITSPGMPAQVVEALTLASEQRTAAQSAALQEYYLEQAAPMAALRQQIADAQAERQQVEESAPLTVVSKAVEPRTIRILPRGNWMDDSGEVVGPAIPEFLGKLETHGQRPTRLDLANWLSAPDNVLTSRTMVNRLWFLMFGLGICTSVDDFGGQGTFPSHPELLDWLAHEFVESGWDVKHMLRTIALSETYRRSSKPTPELRAADPYNELFARQGRLPLAAEMVRDGALAVSGLLVEKIGGPSARPYQPAGYYAELNFPKRKYVASDDDGQYRRGLYTHWQRTFLHPMLKAFDAPSREECTAQRARSNTPVQALTLLNDPTFVEAARVFAARIVREGGHSSAEKIAWAYLLAVSRVPDGPIAAELTQVYEQQRLHYQAHPEAARQLIAVGHAPVDEELEPVELAAWTSVARVILNLHETITRY